MEIEYGKEPRVKWLFTSISWYYGESHQYRDTFGLKTKVEGPNWSFRKLRDQLDPWSKVEGSKWLFCHSCTKGENGWRESILVWCVRAGVSITSPLVDEYRGQVFFVSLRLFSSKIYVSFPPLCCFSYIIVSFGGLYFFWYPVFLFLLRCFFCFPHCVAFHT